MTKPGHILRLSSDGSFTRKQYSHCPQCGHKTELSHELIAGEDGDSCLLFQSCYGKYHADKHSCGWETIIEYAPECSWVHEPEEEE